MNSYEANFGGGLKSLRRVEKEMPQPGSREILVRIRATSLNARELMILEGTYPLPVKPDVVPVSDGAGEVVAVGNDVTRVKIGDRVALNVFAHWLGGPFDWSLAAQIGGSMDGMLREYGVFHEDVAVHIPAHLSFEEAATLPCAALTAWNALTCGAPLAPGHTVLTLGSGGVSLFALQFAKLFGARVIATTSSEEKAMQLREVGADHVINYRETPDWNLAVRELTGGRGVDIVVEVGGAGTIEKSLKSVAVEGQISWVGALASGVSSMNVATLRNSFATLRFVIIGNRAQFVAMNRAIEVNRLRPVMNRSFHFDDAVKAFEDYAAGGHFGKITITHA